MPETHATIGRAARRHTAHRRALVGLSVLLGSAIALVPAFATARPVEPGDTLTDIAEQRYGRSDWTIVLAIAGFNDIEDPNLIIVGDEIALPSRRELRRHAKTAPQPAPEPAVALEHVPGTDWDGDGVIEPEPGTEPVEEAVEETVELEAAPEPEPADPPEEADSEPDTSWGQCSEWMSTALSVGWSEEEWGTLNWIMAAESGCDPGATSSAGAQGLLQVMPMWADDCGGGSLYDPWFNLSCGLHVYHAQGWTAWDVY